MPAKSPEQMLDYLLTHVRLDGACRIWAGSVTSDGMPKIVWRKRGWRAQRLLLDLMGKRTDKLRVWNLCQNKLCMEPDHVTTGTVAQHLQWEYDTGHRARGRQHALRVALGRRDKLGVRALPTLRRLRAEGLTYEQIGEQLQVHPSAVGHLLRRWA